VSRSDVPAPSTCCQWQNKEVRTGPAGPCSRKAENRSKNHCSALDPSVRITAWNGVVFGFVFCRISCKNASKINFVQTSESLKRFKRSKMRPVSTPSGSAVAAQLHVQVPSFKLSLSQPISCSVGNCSDGGSCCCCCGREQGANLLGKKAEDNGKCADMTQRKRTDRLYVGCGLQFR
jgi:hypothetical protein